MKTLSSSEMNKLIGGSFWSALTCGASVASLFIAPTPLGFIAAVSSCGTTFAD